MNFRSLDPARRRSPRPFDLVLGVVAVTVLLWAGMSVRAELGVDRLPLETLVPPETLAFLTLPDIGKAREDWKRTALYKIWEDPEVQHTVDTLLGNIEKYRKEFEKGFLEETGVEFEKALEVFRGQLSIALISMPDQESGSSLPRAAFALDFGDRKEEVEKLLGWVIKQIKDNSPGVEETSWDSDGVKVSVLGDEEFQFHYLLAGPTLLAATHKDVMEGMLARARDASQPCLGTTEKYKKALAEAAPGGRPTFLLYADTKGIVSVVEEMLGGRDEDSAAQVKKILDATGVRGLEAVAMAVTFGDDGISDRIYLHAPGPRDGLLRILTPGVTDMPFLHLVPRDVVGFSAMRMDLALAWDQALEILKQIDEETWKTVTEEIAKFEKNAGVLVRSDLLGSLGKEMSGWSAYPEHGGLLPHSVTTLSLRDPVAFEATLERMYASMGMVRRDLDWMGRKIRYFVASVEKEQEGMPGRPGGMPGGGRGPGFLPGIGFPEMIMVNLTAFSAYYIEDGTLFTSNLVQTLKDVVRKRSAANRPALKDSPEFKKLLDRLPEKPGIVLYIDLKSTFYMIYNSLLPVMQIAEIFLRRSLGVPFETAALPTADAVGRHLAPSITGIANRPSGMVISSYSETGVTAASFMGVAMAGVVAAVAIPSLLRSRTGSNEASAQGTLRALCTGQEQFRSAVCVDVNSNGVGEYGFLQELAGTSPCRTPGGLEGPSFAASPFIPRILGMADPDGKVAKAGYYFKVFIPGNDKAVSSGFQVPAGEEGLADAQENRWCAYAWPIQWGKTGRRAFFINEMGQPYATHSPAYSGENGPAPGAAYSAKGKNPDNLEGHIEEGGPGTDGNFWFPTG